MIRSYTFVLRPLAAQRAELQRWRSQCAEIYNAALEQRRTAWRTRRQSMSYVDQCRDLTDLRREAEYRSVSVEAQRSALRRLQRSFEAFFRRCKRGDTPGFPRFRSWRRYRSFGIGRVKIDMATDVRGSGYVSVPKIGRIRFRQHRAIAGSMRDVALRYDDLKDRWYVKIVCDLGDAPPKVAVDPERVVGIDLGLKVFAVLSDGAQVDNPRHFRRSEERLAGHQRVLSRKRRGSRSRERSRRVVQSTHAKIRNQRLDFHRKLAKTLVVRYDLIAHEDLNIRGLARSALAKSVGDAGWAQFITILTCKAEDAGKHVVAVNPRGTTQACSGCGANVPKGLGDRIHRCGCGVVLDRDHNAAINVLARGLRAVPLATADKASL